MSALSRSDLLSFLNYLSSKGLIPPATASARKAAVNQVLGILDEAEAEDVSKIDVESVMVRFHNLNKDKYTPDSLSTYRSRVRASIDDFLRYQRDPMNFKPGIQAPGRRPADRIKPVDRPPVGKAEKRTGMSYDAPQASVNILPIQIRADLTVKIQGLPFDLTASEAARIANIIKAMAIEE